MMGVTRFLKNNQGNRAMMMRQCGTASPTGLLCAVPTGGPWSGGQLGMLSLNAQAL
jgi:hypothetical protein